MTDHSPLAELTAPTRDAAGRVVVLDPILTDLESPVGLIAHSVYPQRTSALGRFGIGMRVATALQRRSATERAGAAVVAEMDRRFRQILGRGWVVAETHRPSLTRPLGSLPDGLRELPSSLVLRGQAQPHVLDPIQGPLASTLQRMSYTDLARLGRKLARLKRQIQRVLDRLLGGGGYEFASYVPPHDTSPCGVLRMASPEIPRGPQLDLHLDAPAHPWALAA